MRPVFPTIILSLALALVGTANAAGGDAISPALVAERLSLIKGVAIFKAKHDLPVENLERETIVLEAAILSARDLGLDPTTTRAFFQAQIEAAKTIQHCWLARWPDDAIAELEGADLTTEIRPALLDLGNAIVEAIADDVTHERPMADAASFANMLSIDCLTSSAINELRDALLSIELQAK